VRTLFGPLAWPLVPLELALSVPGLLMFAANLEILLRSRVSEGANDNLSAVAALCVLAERLAVDRPRDVEIVLVATGCEEAGWGGARALAREQEQQWDKERTVVIALDCLSNGELRYVCAEGEVSRIPIPAWLDRLVREVAASDPRFARMTGFEAPIGGTDATAFLARGWQAMALVAVDPDLGMPRHYHRSTDTLEQLDLDQLMSSIDFTEKLVRALMHRGT
jgi:Zn-dependent M28 family amino/carboxypeptidase